MAPTRIPPTQPVPAVLPSRTPPVNPPALRLHLGPTLEGQGAVNGAWWPYSHNAGRELPALIDELHRGPCTVISRIELHPGFWTDIPRRIPARGHVITVDRSRAGDLHVITLHTTTGRDDLTLLVVPPEMTAVKRTTAFATVLKGTATVPPNDLRATARTAAADSRTEPPARTWKDDSGHVTRQHGRGIAVPAWSRRGASRGFEAWPGAQVAGGKPASSPFAAKGRSSGSQVGT